MKHMWRIKTKVLFYHFIKVKRYARASETFNKSRMIVSNTKDDIASMYAERERDTR